MQGFFRWTLFPLLILSASMLYAQGTGSITGTIRDSTGAVVPNADITLTDTATKTSLHTTTNADGDYLFAAVSPGTHDLTVTAVGFNTHETKNIVLRVAARVRVDAALAVGEVKTAVTVEAGGVTQVETQSSEVSGVVTGKEMTQMVLNGRNFSQLVMLTPGVVSQTGQQEGTVGVYGRIDYAVNGGRGVYNNWEIVFDDNTGQHNNDLILQGLSLNFCLDY